MAVSRLLSAGGQGDGAYEVRLGAVWRLSHRPPERVLPAVAPPPDPIPAAPEVAPEIAPEGARMPA